MARKQRLRVRGHDVSRIVSLRPTKQMSIERTVENNLRAVVSQPTVEAASLNGGANVKRYHVYSGVVQAEYGIFGVFSVVQTPPHRPQCWHLCLRFSSLSLSFCPHTDFGLLDNTNPGTPAIDLWTSLIAYMIPPVPHHWPRLTPQWPGPTEIQPAIAYKLICVPPPACAYPPRRSIPARMCV